MSSRKYVTYFKGQSVGPTTLIAERAIAAQPSFDEAAKAWLRARGEPLTRAAVAAIAEQMRAEHRAMSMDVQASSLVENERMSAGNRRQRRAAYARARKEGA